MTSEVAILNREAVALAADSAVTIGGSNTQKVFPSAQKMWPLSLRYPIGVMIYNHSALVGVPWETIVASYRIHGGDKSFDTLKEHAEDFLRFICSTPHLFPEEQQTQYIQWLASQLYSHMSDEIKRGLEGNGSGGYPPQNPRAVVDAVCTRWEERLRASPVSAAFNGEAHGNEVVDRYRDATEVVAKAIFEELPLNGTDTERLHRLAADFVIRDNGFLIQESTGVVVAGFGSHDVFPSIQHYLFEGVVGGVVQYQEKEFNTVTFREPAKIVPFAQTDGVELFLNGMDPRLSAELVKLMEELLKTYPDKLLQGLINQQQEFVLRERIEEIAPAILGELQEKLAEVRANDLTRPILNVVAAVPKDELGQMAEDLVSLTAARRRISLEADSVGGPIDVVVISKTDGFVWMRRKHYFDADINTYSPRSDIEEVLSHLRRLGLSEA
jgi:hypothetical protein